mgnify:CR=1 FL=1
MPLSPASKGVAKSQTAIAKGQRHWLRARLVDAVHTRIDNAQMTERERNFDFDMVVGNFRTSLTSGSGLKQYFGSESADYSIFNLSGYSSEAADKLIEDILAAKDRQTLNDATRALDRLLRAEVFWIPQWFKKKHTVAYYDMYRYGTHAHHECGDGFAPKDPPSQHFN